MTLTTATDVAKPAIDLPKRASTMPDGEHKRIGEMLTYRRAHESAGEQEFVDRYITPLGVEFVLEGDEVHAYTLRIKGTDLQNARAFCAHVDSVHNRMHAHTRQGVGYDAFLEQFFVSDDKQRDCLGADDAAGVYVLLRMIEAKVPGLYVFFRGEERGGIGSDYVERNRQDIFEGVTQAIQFDRRGTKSIITQMMCGRTCSDTYALALAKALDMGHVPDDSGSFTDTANLASFVRECTNISVGYDSEHSSFETLDAGYLEALADRCCEVFADGELELPLERNEGEFHSRSRRSSNRYGGVTDYHDDTPTEEGVYTSAFGHVTAYDLPDMTFDEIVELVTELDFVEAATLLFQAGEAVAYAYPTYYTSGRRN